jgi:hypothetical protein
LDGKRRYGTLVWGLLAPLAVLCCGCPYVPPSTDSSSSDNGGTQEPNSSGGGDSLATASALSIDTSGQIDFSDAITAAASIRVYQLGTLAPGDHVRIDVRRTGGDLDGVAAIFDPKNELIAFNDDRAPDGSDLNPLIDFTLRGKTGAYYLAITDYPGKPTSGSFQVTGQIQRGGAVPAGQAQTVYLNWRGGHAVIPNVGTFDLPAFDAQEVGLLPEQTAPLEDRVQQVVKDRYNGFNLIVLSSAHDAEPNTPHSTVYFGASSAQAFAISQQIDSYNQDPSDKAIVFTEGFQDAFMQTPTLEELATAIGNTVAHETGHLLGLVHTADCNDMMDTSCFNDRILSPQEFSTAALDSSVFPFGVQPERDLLAWILGLVGM